MATKERIIEYLRENPDKSAAEIGRTLSLTRSDIQYHLKRLCRNKLIETKSHTIDWQSGKGRPQKFYHLSNFAQPDNHPHLIKALLHLYMDEHGTSQSLRTLAKKMFPPLVDKNNSLLLNKTSTLLCHHNYQASWEARAFGPLMIFKNCPYKAILPEIPDLCSLDIFILENITGSQVSRFVKTDTMKSGKSICQFWLNINL